jgi:hypothetical protein
MSGKQLVFILAQAVVDLATIAGILPETNSLTLAATSGLLLLCLALLRLAHNRPRLTCTTPYPLLNTAMMPFGRVKISLPQVLAG